MEQRDYLLNEIEKIGLLLRMIFNKLAGREETYSLSLEGQTKEVKEILLHEIGFDIDLFLSLGETEIEPYISKFKGFNGLNIELLTDIINEIGMRTESAQKNIYLEQALIMYHLCNSLDKTFSLERESKISEINRVLLS